MDKYILIYDSGLGAEYVFSCLKKVLPSENYIIFKDKKNIPYGNKSKEKLKEIFFTNICKIFSKYSVKLVIIACNTIGSLLKEEIKKAINLPILFVSPKINKKILKNKTLILATTNTIMYNLNVSRYKNDKNAYFVGFNDLAKRIEDAKNYDELLPFLYENLKKYQNLGIKNIVLGCTHYGLIKNELKKIFKDVNFYDDSLDIAKKAVKIIKKDCDKNFKIINLYS